jgi:hypothetical protein
MVMSGKATRFLAALLALCREHQVALAVSGYDALQIWDSEVGELDANGIQDRTTQGLGPVSPREELGT